MTLLLRDSINAPLIPPDTPVVAGYGDGKFIWSPSWVDGSNWWDLFPNAVKLVLVVDAAHSGDVLDVEVGDAAPADVPGWCDRFSRPGRRAPTVYCNRSTLPAVQQAVGGRRVDYWIATLDGTQDVPGAVAVQYIDTGPYDESIIHDPSWVGLNPPNTTEADGMGFLSRDVTAGTLDEVFARSDGHAVWGTFTGGAGQWESWTGGLTDLGSPQGAADLVTADGAFTTDPNGRRLNVRGIRRDGSRWIKVMNADTFGQIQDWVPAISGGNEFVPAGATVPPHKHPATLSGTTGDPQ